MPDLAIKQAVNSYTTSLTVHQYTLQHFDFFFVNQVLSFPFHEGYVAGIFKLALYKNVSVFIGLL